MGNRKQFGTLFSLLAIVAIPAAIIVRSSLIHREAPKVVRLIKEYKTQHQTYPKSLRELDAKVRFGSMYIYDAENDEFILQYSLFVFHRWYYSSKKDRWGYLD